MQTRKLASCSLFPARESQHGQKRPLFIRRWPFLLLPSPPLHTLQQLLTLKDHGPLTGTVEDTTAVQENSAVQDSTIAQDRRAVQDCGTVQGEALSGETAGVPGAGGTPTGAHSHLLRLCAALNAEILNGTGTGSQENHHSSQYPLGTPPERGGGKAREEGEGEGRGPGQQGSGLLEAQSTESWHPSHGIRLH